MVWSRSLGCWMSKEIISSNYEKCYICFENPPDAVLMDCGHGGSCVDCSKEMLKSGKTCPFCWNEIVSVI